MRILMINRNDHLDGGADRVFLNTYDLLQQAISYSAEYSAWQVDKFTRAEAGLENSRDPRSLSVWGKIRLVKDYLYNKKVGLSLEKKIRDFKPDMAHVHLIFGTLSVSVLRILNHYRIPVIMTVHDYRLICPANAMLDRHGRICERCRGSRYYNCLIHRCSGGNIFFSAVIMAEAYMRKFLFRPIKLVDHFIFVSQFSRNKHLQFEPRYALKSTHLYNMNMAVPEVPAVKGSYFLYFGRISPEKGLATLIPAALEAGIRLVIAGNGPQEEDLRRLLDDRTLRQREEEGSVELIGYKSGIDLEDLIRNCSFTVVPSEWYENNPMSVVESFSLGKPVIGSEIGGIPELVTTRNGLLFEAGNQSSLAEVLRKARVMPVEQYRDMSSACLEFAAKNFDRDLHLEGLRRIYQVAVDRS